MADEPITPEAAASPSTPEDAPAGAAEPTSDGKAATELERRQAELDERERRLNDVDAQLRQRIGALQPPTAPNPRAAQLDQLMASAEEGDPRAQAQLLKFSLGAMSELTQEVKTLRQERREWDSIPADEAAAVKRLQAAAEKRGEPISVATARDMVKEMKASQPAPAPPPPTPKPQVRSQTLPTTPPPAPVNSSAGTMKVSDYNALYDSDPKAFADAMRKKDAGDLRLVSG